jgi:hypothetical protein
MKRILLFLVSIGMELSYLYACATFLTTSIFHRPFPFLEAAGSFVLAALLTLVSEGRGWRIIYIVILQAAGFVPALWGMIRIFASWEDSFMSQTWLVKFYDNPVGATEWFVGLLVLLWIVAFWREGMGMAKRPRDYFTLCSRFDRGLIAFFLLYLVKFLLRVRGEIQIQEPVSEFLVFPFLTFSLLAIGLVRHRSAGEKDFLPGYRGIGVIFSFIVVTLLFGTGLILFCLPFLTLAAETGFDILKIAAGPVGYVLLKILRFIFGTWEPGPEREIVKKEKLPDRSPGGPAPWWLELLGKILSYALWIILGILLLVIIGVTLYYLYKWLLSRNESRGGKQSPRDLLSLFFEHLRSLLRSFRRALSRILRGYKNAAQLYTALLVWGRHSGMYPIPSETPAEYGLRLRERFPALKTDFESIIGAFHEEVYGEIILDEHQLTSPRSAWHRLRSPLLWPQRVKAWFRRPLDPLL